MDIIERLGFGLVGILLGAGIAMGIDHWMDPGSPAFVFKVCMGVGGIGGFLIGREFLEFLSSFFDRIW